MSSFAELRAALCRRACGVTGIAGARQAWRLVEWLGNVVSIEHRPGEKPRYAARRDGGARIRLPVLTDDRAEAWILLEEIGHFLWRAGQSPARVHPFHASTAELTLDELREDDEEGHAARFRLAFLLPPEWMLCLRADWELYELMEAANLDLATIRLRLDQVRREPFTWPRSPPAWCAWGHFHLEFVPSRVLPRIRVLALGRTSAPIEVPCSESFVPAMTERLHLDLAALRPEEFLLKYRGEQAGRPRSLDQLWQEYAPDPSPALLRAGCG